MLVEDLVRTIKKNTGGFLRVIFGGIFIVASISKIISPDAFIRDISNYKILPPAFLEFFGRTLPYVELILGSLLVLDIWWRTAAVILSALLIVFIFAILSTILRGIDIECGCFSGLVETSKQGHANPWFLILRDMVFLALGLKIVFSRRNRIPAKVTPLN